MGMFHVIAEPCIGVKDAGCVQDCPVDCIHGDENSAQLFINPDECIGCGICVTVCPVEAIYEDDSLPDQWKHYVGINAAYFANR
jgi:ferredoxin